MALNTRLVYDGKAEGIFAPEAFDHFMKSDLPGQIGGEQITIQVRKHVEGNITTYTLLPLAVNVPYECTDGTAVVGVVGRNVHNLDKVCEAILSAQR